MYTLDSAGNPVIITDANKAYAYNGDGTVNTVTATTQAGVWVKTYTYAAGAVSVESGWVKQ